LAGIYNFQSTSSSSSIFDYEEEDEEDKKRIAALYIGILNPGFCLF